MGLNFLRTPYFQEVRDEHNLSAYSRRAIQNMLDYSVVRLFRLEKHEIFVETLYENEYDLRELMQLAVRLRNIEGNAERLRQKIELLKAELTKRKIREAAEAAARGPRGG